MSYGAIYKITNNNGLFEILKYNKLIRSGV